MHGRLVSWTFDRAVATGLDNLAHGTLVDVGGAAALVTGLLRDSVELMPLSPRPPAIGALVRARGPLVVPAGDDVEGRTIDCLGDPLDASPPLARDVVEPVFGRDPTILGPGVRRWTLGSLVYDLQQVRPLGASVIATGPREVLHHLLRHQEDDGRRLQTTFYACSAGSAGTGAVVTVFVVLGLALVRRRRVTAT
ncbi:MAG: MYXO-CTERM sorting domain-containing protein [Kofleriaceae bacterium]